MKVMYRPHRSIFNESVKETKIFNSLFDMFKQVAIDMDCESIGDVCIFFYAIEDKVMDIDWTGENYIVCITNRNGIDYGCPIAIGFCKFVEE